MSSKGSPHAQFQRAIKQGNVLLALAVARELPPLSLENSFALLLLLAEKDPDRFRYAAPRWHARFVLDAKGLDLAESRLALAAVELLPGELSQTGIALIEGLARRRRRGPREAGRDRATCPPVRVRVPGQRSEEPGDPRG